MLVFIPLAGLALGVFAARVFGRTVVTSTTVIVVVVFVVVVFVVAYERKSRCSDSTILEQKGGMKLPRRLTRHSQIKRSDEQEKDKQVG